MARGRALAREHWLFAAALGCATALRVVVLLAYQQALIFPDSERYLQYAQAFLHGQWTPDWLRTSGYSLLLMPAVWARNLAVVAAVQHLLGLATGVLVYALLVRCGARRWLAVLACVPVLFDPLQLDLEQYILTDVSATFLLVVALVVLVWKREAIGAGALVSTGLLIAAATVIRESDLLVAIPALAYLVIIFRRRGAGRPGRRCCCWPACCRPCSATSGGSTRGTGRGTSSPTATSSCTGGSPSSPTAPACRCRPTSSTCARRTPRPRPTRTSTCGIRAPRRSPSSRPTG